MKPSHHTKKPLKKWIPVQNIIQGITQKGLKKTRERKATEKADNMIKPMCGTQIMKQIYEENFGESSPKALTTHYTSSSTQKLKLSYSCMPNTKAIVTSHNKKILSSTQLGNHIGPTSQSVQWRSESWWPTSSSNYSS